MAPSLALGAGGDRQYWFNLLAWIRIVRPADRAACCIDPGLLAVSYLVLPGSALLCLARIFRPGSGLVRCPGAAQEPAGGLGLVWGVRRPGIGYGIRRYMDCDRHELRRAAACAVTLAHWTLLRLGNLSSDRPLDLPAGPAFFLGGGGRGQYALDPPGDFHAVGTDGGRFLRQFHAHADRIQTGIARPACGDGDRRAGLDQRNPQGERVQDGTLS